jgi:hypothetical protein
VFFREEPASSIISSIFENGGKVGFSKEERDKEKTKEKEKEKAKEKDKEN